MVDTVTAPFVYREEPWPCPWPCPWPSPQSEAEAFEGPNLPAVIVARDKPRLAKGRGYTEAEADAFRAGMEAAAKIAEPMAADVADAIRAEVGGPL